MGNYLESAISKLYGDDDDFIVLGLTGQTGSGCSTVASIVQSEMYEIRHSLFNGDNPQNNEHRKQKIIAKHFDKNWEPFYVIEASSVLTLLLAECGVRKSLEYILKKGFLHRTTDKGKVAFLKSQLREIKSHVDKDKEFFCRTLIEAHKKIKERLGLIEFVKLYQQLGTNVRKSGSPIGEELKEGNFFALADKINSILKTLKKENKKENSKTLVVIDAIRNPLEAIFFQERYAAFFLIAVSCSDDDRKERLRKLNYTEGNIDSLDKQENENRSFNDKSTLTIQDIQTCLQKADLYIHNPNTENEHSKFLILANQILKFVSLMKRPGLVSPTAIERCMQIAYTAKLNSGCISRQVGAVITNNDFSIRAVGWNDTPHQQVPCNLRNRFDLLAGKDQSAFSTFEKDNKEYREWFSEETKKYISIEDSGRNVSYCFKAEYNNLQNKNINNKSECKNSNVKCKDNQVHTRSLHAEENAFLQISKYGGQGIEGGFLFSTASPCELCSKKAYQLGIRQIYYIDPYPGIAINHILKGGTNNPKLILFSGAIGRAFHRLYMPVVPYKDELNALTGNSK